MRMWAISLCVHVGLLFGTLISPAEQHARGESGGRRWLAAVSTELVARISVERKANAYSQLTVSH